MSESQPNRGKSDIFLVIAIVVEFAAIATLKYGSFSLDRRSSFWELTHNDFVMLVLGYFLLTVVGLGVSVYSKRWPAFMIQFFPFIWMLPQFYPVLLNPFPRLPL
jgi:hypothetical protein